MPVDHYENFPVASIFLPRRLQKPVAVIYRFARSADDIADEGSLANEERLARLDEFRCELKKIEKDKAPSMPLFQSLAAEISEHGLPLPPFFDLLDAFSQDVVKKRYENFEDLLDYCRRSANPVGNLLLHLYNDATEVNIGYSDAICTSLQLINFWQDVEKDYAIGRIYLPLDEMQEYGVSEDQIARKIVDENFRKLMKFQVDRSRALMLKGAPLGSVLKGRIGLEMRMIIAGGMRILDKLEAANFDLYNRRPVLRPMDWVIMLAKSAPFYY